MKNRIFIALFFSLGCFSASTKAGAIYRDSLKSGLYRAEIKGYQGIVIPFLFSVKSKAQTKEISLINDSERIKSKDILQKGDSVFITLPFFDSDLRFKIEGTKLEGYWVRYLPSGNRHYSVRAVLSQEPRFKESKAPKVNVSGLWDINFPTHHHPSIGEFIQQKNGRVTGSILSVTGDDRYLEGKISGDSLYLSTFDGAHAYLFKARVNSLKHNLENGQYFALNNPPVFFTGQFNPKAHLEDVYSITRLKPGLDTLAFHFKDINGVEISYPNEASKNKIVLIQFMGSWCPNCMDETAFLTEFYKKHKDQVSIFGLSYERSNDWTLSRNAVQRFSDRFGIEYPVLVTGFKNQNEEVMKSIPQLANFEGFPTLIIIDKKGKVQKIHTGFSGPGTGKYYQDFVTEFDELFKELSAEN